MTDYIFQRAEGFYTVQYGSTAEALKGAELNEGTIRVVSVWDSELIWTCPPKAVE
jgi:hypothetical protein